MGEYLTTNQFVVCISNVIYGFSRISNLMAEAEFETVQEGGRNWTPLLFPKHKEHKDILTLEYGALASTKGDGRAFKPGVYLSSVIIMVKRNGTDYLKFTFDEGIVTKMVLADLDAMRSEVLIRKMEIAHTGLYEI